MNRKYGSRRFLFLRDLFFLDERGFFHLDIAFVDVIYRIFYDYRVSNINAFFGKSLRFSALPQAEEKDACGIVFNSGVIRVDKLDDLYGHGEIFALSFFFRAIPARSRRRKERRTPTR